MIVSSRLPDLAQQVESLRGAELRGLSDREVAKRLGDLLKGYMSISVNHRDRGLWYRGRKSPKAGWANIKEMLYPPSTTEYGRANRPGDTVLYASSNIRTVLEEIGAAPGDFVQIVAVFPVSTGTPQSDPKFHMIGEHESTLGGGRSLLGNNRSVQWMEQLLIEQPAYAHDLFFLDSFLSEAFRRPAVRSHEYRLTAVYAASVMQDEGGLIYPSVQARGGINVAIHPQTFDAHFRVAYTVIFEVKRYFAYGVYECDKPIRFSKTFNASGEIDWAEGQSFEGWWNLTESGFAGSSETGWRNTRVKSPASPTARGTAEPKQATPAASPRTGLEEMLTAEVWMDRGNSARDPAERVRCYSEAIRLKPDFAPAYNNRGGARAEAGDRDGAYKDFDEAIRLKLRDAQVYANRANIRNIRGDLVGARQDLDEAIRLKPDFALAYNNRGSVREATGDLQGALHDFGQAIRLAPDYALAYRNRSRVRQATGDRDGARRDLNLAAMKARAPRKPRR